MKYAYTAVITPDDNNSFFLVRVPDLPGCVTSGSSVLDAIDMATDAASIWLVGAENDGDEISPPTNQSEIPHEPGDIMTVIQIDTLKYRAEIDDHAVRKNVSIPAWMAAMAEKRKINCSQVLQDGLRAIFESN